MNKYKVYKLTVCDIKGFQKQFIQSDECKGILWISSETRMKRTVKCVMINVKLKQRCLLNTHLNLKS